MIFLRRTFRSRASWTERGISLACVGLLIAIGAWFAWRGGQADPDLFRLDERLLATAAAGPQIHRRAPVTLASEPAETDAVRAALAAPPPGFQLDGRIESFGPDTLYEKIDGRESLYKAHAFRRLWAATYIAAGDRLDVEVFQQGSATDALGVLSAERQGLAGSGHAADRTTTPNGVYRAAGAHYLRIFGTRDSAGVRAAAARLADHLAAAIAPSPAGAATAGPAATASAAPGRAGAGDPAGWTPARNPLVALGADPATVEFVPADGLGVRAFARMFLGPVPEGAERVKTFIVLAADAAAARAAVEAFGRQVGPTGTPVRLPWAGPPPADLVAIRVELLDTVEAAVPVGRLVVGVTEAPGPEVAARVLARAVAALRSPATARSAAP